MFEEQRKREVAAATGQQQQHTAASREPPPSYNTDGGLRAMLSQSATQGSSQQPGNLRKDFFDCYYRGIEGEKLDYSWLAFPSNDTKDNCCTHVGSSSLHVA